MKIRKASQNDFLKMKEVFGIQPGEEKMLLTKCIEAMRQR